MTGFLILFTRSTLKGQGVGKKPLVEKTHGDGAAHAARGELNAMHDFAKVSQPPLDFDRVRLQGRVGACRLPMTGSRRSPASGGGCAIRLDNLAVQLEAIASAAEAGLQDHVCWLSAGALLARGLDGRRSTSRLPALLDYVVARPA
jgi:hypothetical protein